jgi:hypothetical protein
VDYEVMGYLGRSDHTINTATLVGPMKEEESVEMVPDWGKVYGSHQLVGGVAGEDRAGEHGDLL